MPLEKIRLLCSATSHMPLHFVFRDSGVTERHGFELEVDIVRIGQDGRPARSMRDRAPSLLRGDYEFLSGLHHEPFEYRAKGDKRLVYLAQTQNDWDDRLVARSDIKEPKQLEGKRVLTAAAPCVAGNLDHALRLAGVDTSQVEFILTRDADAGDWRQFDKVYRGEVDAASVAVPFDLRARKKGFNLISLPPVPVIHNTTVCASMEFVRAHEDTVDVFLKALIEAIYFFKTEKQKVCSILERTIAPLIGVEGDEEVEHLQEEWSKLLSVKPYPHPLAVWNVYNLDVAQNPKINFIGPFEIWDLHYVREIDDSGFIDGLYRSVH